MIAKITSGKSFAGVVNYLFEGHKGEQTDKRAVLLDYNGIRPAMRDMIADFNSHRKLNPGLGNAVAHASMSYHESDKEKVSDPVMVQHARLFLISMDIDPENTQWALIAHHDRSHPHWHLVYNRVDADGKTISDSNNYKRAHAAARTVALLTGFTIAARQAKNLPAINESALPEHDKSRLQIYQAVGEALCEATGMSEFTALLQKSGIETRIKRGDKGMSFKLGNHAFKASAIDRQYTGAKIHARLEENRLVQARRQRSAKRRDELRLAYTGLSNYRFFRHKQAKVKAVPALKRIQEAQQQRAKQRQERWRRVLEASQQQRELEAQRQRELEASQQQRELEAQRQRELEAQRQRELEAQRQRELEAQRQRELEAQRQRKVPDDDQITHRLNDFYYLVGLGEGPRQSRGKFSGYALWSWIDTNVIKAPSGLQQLTDYLSASFPNPEAAGELLGRKIVEQQAYWSRTPDFGRYDRLKSWPAERRMNIRPVADRLPANEALARYARQECMPDESGNGQTLERGMRM